MRLTPAQKALGLYVVAAALIFLSMLVLFFVATAQSVPRCGEDEWLRGDGAFSGGKWTRYECSHPEVVRP